MPRRLGHAARVALDRSVCANAAPAYATDASDVEGEARPWRTARARAAGAGAASAATRCRMLHPEARRGDHELLAPRQTAAMRDGKERDAVKVDAFDARVGVEDHVEEQVPGFVRGEADQRRRRGTSTIASPRRIVEHGDG